MPKLENWWEYQSRRQRKQETVVKIPEPAKPATDPYAKDPYEVKESRLSETGLHRMRKLFFGEKS